MEKKDATYNAHLLLMDIIKHQPNLMTNPGNLGLMNANGAGETLAKNITDLYAGLIAMYEQHGQ